MIARLATPEDLPGVIVVSKHWTATPPTPECVTILFDGALEAGGMFVAVVSENCPRCEGWARIQDGEESLCPDCCGSGERDRVVGFLCAWVLPHPFNGEPYANVIAWLVEPAHRDTWAAAGLFRRFLRWASTTPLYMVTISLPVNARVGTLFERAGFELVEHKRSYIKRG